MAFKPANRSQNKLRLCLDGPSGAGKTFTALRLAHHLAGDSGRIAVVDTEHGSASKYVGTHIDGMAWAFDAQNLEYFSPAYYERAIKEAGAAAYDVLIIDSLSHAWIGVGGALNQVDMSQSKNSFSAWKEVSPQHTSLVETMLRCPCNLIVTLRSKMEYVLEPDERGKMVPRKIGLKPIQRDGIEYEFDVVGDLDLAHVLKVSKSRCPDVDQKSFPCPGGEFIEPIRTWLTSGTPYIAPAAVQTEVPIDGQPSNGNGIPLNTSAPVADEFQAQRIRDLAQHLSWNVEKLKEVLLRKGAKRILELSKADADGLILAMEEKFQKAQADQTF